MRTGVMVRDAMTKKPVTTVKEISISDCARLMSKHDIGSVIVEEKGELIGIVTEYDLTNKVVAKEMDYNSPISTIMETAIITIEGGRDLEDAIRLMRMNDIRHLPVVEGEEFIGLVTMKDVLKIQPELFEIVVEKIKLREEENKPIGFAKDFTEE